MADEKYEGKKPVVEQISLDKASKILGDAAFLRERKLDRILHVVRDPKDPSIIVSMTVMENIAR